MRLCLALAALIALAPGAPVHAQDWRRDTYSPVVTLRSGFTPGPYTVNLQSGGAIDASQSHEGCVGYIAREPDFRLHWIAGDPAVPLMISVASDFDTTLLINGPDMQWRCNDDAGRSLNPAIFFSNAATGIYEIWVGTYGEPTRRPAQLRISELYE